MGIKLSGVEVAKKYRNDLKELISSKVNEGIRAPFLASILIGEDGGSLSYINNQMKISNEVGVKYETYNFKEDLYEDEIIKKIHELNNDDKVDGIMLQLPLPKKFNEEKIISAIAYNKDVDGLTDVNLGRFYKGDESFVPCTAKSVLELIKSADKDLNGKTAVIVGRSNIVGKPAAFLLLNENCTITVCHSKTKNLKEVCKGADILAVALGKPDFITADYIKQGAIVIDVGTTMVEGKVRGDVQFQDVIDVSSYATPVPGGVGAMTTTMLMKNTCEAWLRNVCKDNYCNSSK
jgi:methylenetetrahydrofolate dehydrogenase (NADP+)/methenyltetrahydrofolate cyclohydrolase